MNFFRVVAEPTWVQYLICNQVATSVFYGVLYRHFCILWCPVSTLCILCCPVFTLLYLVGCIIHTSVFCVVLYPHSCKLQLLYSMVSCIHTTVSGGLYSHSVFSVFCVVLYQHPCIFWAVFTSLCPW